MFTKTLVLTGILFLVLALTADTAVAEIEYTGGILAFQRGNILLQATYNPSSARVACNTDNSVCVAVVYEKGGFLGYTQGLKLFHSSGGSSLVGMGGKHFQNLAYSCGSAFGWDAFWAGCHTIAVPSNWNVDYDNIDSYGGMGDEYPYPYDVFYSETDDVFYVIFTGGTMGASGARPLYVYEYAGDLTAPTLKHSQTCGGFVSTVNTTHYFYMYGCEQRWTGNYDHFLQFYACKFSDGSCSLVNEYQHYSSGGQQKLCREMHLYKGYGFYNDDGNFQYQVYCTITYSNSPSCTFPTNLTASYDAFTYTGSVSGFDYYDGSHMYVSVGSNSTHKVQTDGASFGTSELVYNWSASESINHSDSDTNNKNRVYLWDRGGVAPLGIYAYNRRLYPFRVLAEGLDVLSGAPESLNVTAQVTCFSENYTATSTGLNPTVSTPCLEESHLTITVSGDWQPQSVQILNLTVLSTEGNTYAVAPASNLGWVNSYNFTLKFVDSFTGGAVAGADITVDGITRVTDSDGEVEFYLSPYDTASFIVTSFGDTYYLYLNGSLKTHEFDFAKVGYQSATDTFRLTDDETPDDVSDFSIRATVQVDPIFLRMITDVFTSDGVHYDGDQVVVRVGGAQNGTYFDDDGVYVDRNYATSFPATFILIDQRASWTAYVNLTQGLYFVQDTVSVTNTTSLIRYDFNLPNSSASQECATDAGCTQQFCKGTLWYDDVQCLSGLCVYDVESCLLCDDDAGCYDGETTETCPTGLDYECYGENYCVDTKTLRSYKCGSGNKCIWELVVCDSVCTDDVCVPPPDEVVVLCDQSDVTGMLSCTQMGITNFIGSTYDPFITIALAIALVFIIIAIFGVAFKGASSVIR